MKPAITIFLALLILVLLAQIPIKDGYDLTRHQPAGVPIAAVNQTKPSFPPVDILAYAAVVVDYPEGRLIFEKNAQAPMALASLSKLMTALAVRDLIGNPAITFFARVSEEDVLMEGDSGFLVGEEFSSNDLLDAMLVGSSNDAAHALARTSILYDVPVSGKQPAFVELMNKKAQDLDLLSMRFFNETGLDISASAVGALGSAGDVAKIFLLVLRDFPELLADTKNPDIRIKSVSGRTINIKNSNNLAGTLPGLIASKTGFTDIAGGNLVLAVDIGFQNPVIIVVLGSSGQGRFDDVLKLYEATKSYFESS